VRQVSVEVYISETISRKMYDIKSVTKLQRWTLILKSLDFSKKYKFTVSWPLFTPPYKRMYPTGVGPWGTDKLYSYQSVSYYIRALSTQLVRAVRPITRTL